MTTERRVSDRRVSPAVTEYAAMECERLRAVNAALLDSMKRIASLPEKSSLHTADDLAVSIARAALSRAKVQP